MRLGERLRGARVFGRAFGRFLALAAPLALLPPLAAGGCAAREARVERGELVKTGDREFDAFFAELHELGKKTEAAEKKERKARGELAEALGLKPDAEADASVEAALDKARAHKDEGLLLHLRLTPEPKVVTAREGSRGRKAQPEAVEALARAIELATKSEIELSRELDELAERAASLESKRRELVERTQSIKGKRPTEKRAIKHELEAAEEVLRRAEERSRRTAGLASKFVLDLAQAVETGAAEAPPSAPPPPAAVAKGRPAGKRPGKPSGSKPARGATKPASAPAKPAGADFDR